MKCRTDESHGKHSLSLLSKLIHSEWESSAEKLGKHSGHFFSWSSCKIVSLELWFRTKWWPCTRKMLFSKQQCHNGLYSLFTTRLGISRLVNRIWIRSMCRAETAYVGREKRTTCTFTVYDAEKSWMNELKKHQHKHSIFYDSPAKMCFYFWNFICLLKLKSPRHVHDLELLFFFLLSVYFWMCLDKYQVL